MMTQIFWYLLIVVVTNSGQSTIQMPMIYHSEEACKADIISQNDKPENVYVRSLCVKQTFVSPKN